MGEVRDDGLSAEQVQKNQKASAARPEVAQEETKAGKPESTLDDAKETSAGTAGVAADVDEAEGDDDAPVSEDADDGADEEDGEEGYF